MVGKIYTPVGQPIPSDEIGQQKPERYSITDWSEAQAKAIAKEARKLRGKVVYVFGGGGLEVT